MAMPPAPDVVEDYRSKEALSKLSSKLEAMRAAGINQLQPVKMADVPATLDANYAKQMRALVILVDFDDHPADGGLVSGLTAEDFRYHLFSQDSTATGSLTDYYLEASYGNLLIEGDVYGWYRMPLDYENYVGSRYGTQSEEPNARTMARDAVIAADADVDFSQYDYNFDGEVDAFFVVHSGPGAEGLPEPT
jgi:hypothetical protein